MTPPSPLPGRRPGSDSRGILLALVLGTLAPDAAGAPGIATDPDEPPSFRRAEFHEALVEKQARSPSQSSIGDSRSSPLRERVMAAEQVGKEPTPLADSGLDRAGIHRIGLVTLDRAARTVRFPAAVNQRAGLIEYAVVTTTGKVHESIFRTEAAPRDIHLAMLLLGVKPANTNVLHDDPHTPLPGERIGIEVGWQRGRKEVRRPLADFVKIGSRVRSSGSRGWLYNGSFLVNGDFAAQRGGSIVSLITDASALVNNPGPDRSDDEIHQVLGKALPREDSPVEIILRVLGQ